ncbi:MAG: hypothetical protein LBM60_06990 [Clostridium sp.]|jgi:hypothetical protein|nr:hypothetical protein [Clostridium sp.]
MPSRKTVHKALPKSIKYVDQVVFILLWAALCVVMYTLFLNQAQMNYESDMLYYVPEISGIDTKYSFPYPVFFRLGTFFTLFWDPAVATAAATLVFNALAIIIIRVALQIFFYNDILALTKRFAIWVGPMLSLLTCSVFYVSMLLPPPGRWIPGMSHVYMGVFTPNPFNNATYLAARPFAIATFLMFVHLLDRYEKGVDPSNRKKELGEYCLFSCFLLLSTMTKPSFTLIFIASAGCVMGFRLIRSKFRNFKNTMLLTLCFVPTFIDMLYQYGNVFTKQAGGEGIGLEFAVVWSQYTTSIPIAIVVATVFPLFCLLLNFGELRTNSSYRFSWIMFLMSLTSILFLYEKGFRKWDFNFSWGYMYGLFFLFFASLCVLIRKTIQHAGARKQGLEIRKYNLHTWLLAAQWLAYTAHLISGLCYFIPILQGGAYY